MTDKKEKKEEKEIIKIPVAKRHRVLQDISNQMKGVSMSDTFEVLGHKFYMTTLNADEEVWADGFTNLQTQMSAITSIRVPKLAASIKAIDDVSVEELFDFSEDTTEFDKEYHSESQYRKRYWVMQQMLLWLGDQPNDLVIELWRNYTNGLIKRKNDAFEELKNSSAGIPGGNSKATSSPEKESSQAVQM